MLLLGALGVTNMQAAIFADVGVMAVSYTHLDVYKRQAYPGETELFQSASAAVRCPQSPRHPASVPKDVQETPARHTEKIFAVRTQRHLSLIPI